MDDAKAIEKIEQLVKDGLTVEVGGRKYSAASLKPVIYEPRTKTVELDTLKGFCGFINSDIDNNIRGEPHLVVVESHKSVALVSAAGGDDLQRSRPVAAALCDGLKGFPFDSFMEQEKFAIMFRSRFERKAGDDFDYVLQLVSKLVGDTAVETEDDGITQKVAVKKGVTGVRVDKAELKPIVRLSPYRTFREIDQPESEFLLRVRMEGDSPQVALFEADGGAWINQAMANIVAYIESQVEGIPVIA